MNFAQVLAGAAPIAGGLSAFVPEEWHQGRTAYGGFSAALALHAAKQATGEGLPPLRSATINFVGPLYGDVEARARVLRRGRNATWVDAEITRDGEVGMTACFVFMGAVDSALHLNDCPPPSGLIAPDRAQVFPADRHAPACRRENYEVRFALPRGEKRPELCWWVRLNERGGLDPMVEMILVADALPPGVLPLLSPGVPVSSMTWLANLLSPAPVTQDGWWLMRSSGDYSERGCSSQRMAIWNTDGTPIMAGMQSVALFG